MQNKNKSNQNKEKTILQQREVYTQVLGQFKIGEPKNLVEENSVVKLSYAGYRFNLFEYFLIVLKYTTLDTIKYFDENFKELLPYFDEKEITSKLIEGEYPEIKTEVEHTTARLLVKDVKRLRTARERIADAENQPKFEPLLGDLIQTGCLTILFSDTGVGKSILVAQLADSLSKGNTELLGQKSIARPLRVLLYDNEISDVEFHNRYNKSNPSDFFYVATNLVLDKDGIDLDKFYTDVHKTNADVVIVDNITAVSLESTHDTEASLNIMRNLVEIKNHLGIALIIVAHVPKIEPYSVLTPNSLGGSKQLSNFSDAVIAIGRTRENINMRYLKAIKQRNSAETDDVITIELVNEPGNLRFRNIGRAKEWDLIKKKKESDDSVLALAIEFKKQGLSYKEIGERIGKSKTSVSRLLSNNNEAA